MADDVVSDDTERDRRADAVEVRAHWWSRLAARPLVLGAVLALIGMNVATVRPQWGIDSSFRVGLTTAVLDRMPFGVDIVWPYGPLGFLGGPTMLDRGLLALALAYQFVALTALFAAMVVHLTRLGLGRWWAVAVLAPFALAVSITENLVPEIVTVALIVVLVVLWQEHRVDRPVLPSPTTWWIVAITGVLAGAQVLVKFGPGVVACVFVIGFAAASAQRLVRLPLALAAIVVGFLTPWFVTGQPVSALRPYFRTSLELSSGYQEAQAWGPYGGKMAVIGVVTIVAAGVGAIGGYRWVRRERPAWWVLLLLAIATWFTLKQGLVRWDPWHIVGALLIIGLLVATLRWERRLLVLPIGVLLVGTLATFATEPSLLRSTWSARADTALVLVSSGRQASELAEARAEVRAAYDVPVDVIEALSDGSVHAEEWDINAVWANDLEWNPLPVIQSYSTYTSELDRINAQRYASARGPDGVLLNPLTVDDRYSLWESPDARVALTCNFIPVAEQGDWTALRRAPDACGPARELGTVRVAPGETIDIPQAARPDELVVARFDLPSDPIGRLLTTFARPLQYAGVTLDGTPYRLVTGTAENAHLLRSPGRVGDRELPHGQVEHSTLSFSNVGSGPITVTFEEVPLEAP